MDSNQLNYIAYLTQTTSLTKVAEHFFTSHQVVKKAISSLEDELGVKLLQSTNQGSQLTPAGICVATHARSFQKEYLALQEDLKAFRPEPADEITELHLYVVPNMGNEFYLDLYDSFFENYTNIKLITHVSTFPQMLKESAAIENCIYLTPLFKAEEMLTQFQILMEKYQLKATLLNPVKNYACMHKHSKYAKLNNPSLTDLQEAPIYVFLNTNPLCFSDDTSDNTLQYFSDYSILKRNIKKNQAIGVIKKYEYDYYFGENNSEYILRPLKDSDIYHAVIVSEKLLSANQWMQEFIRFLQDKLN